MGRDRTRTVRQTVSLAELNGVVLQGFVGAEGEPMSAAFRARFVVSVFYFFHSPRQVEANHERDGMQGPSASGLLLGATCRRRGEAAMVGRGG